ncbi:hypothetical protein [Paraclostridium sp. AKS81]|uniref:hypothetical protein n=1 Tax=Paraclostridium sp. AKS81 TaxID=2876117 RepID=UPI0021E0B708|nr:hypothetical protein [Paraclostridium sp. AKS81]MCU9811049.1 hypothetical protein [Paraclostridium sp. AKS81]
MNGTWLRVDDIASCTKDLKNAVFNVYSANIINTSLLEKFNTLLRLREIEIGRDYI